MSQPNEVDETPAEAFIAELKRWRDVRGLSQSALARKVGYTPSYVSKVETGQQRPSDTFADSADRELQTGGALKRTFFELDQWWRRSGGAGAAGDAGRTRPPDPQSGGLVVEHDEAELRYDGGAYRAHQRRKLLNAGDEPIARYLIRISVDRHPGDPERSNQLYREQPLTWEELGLQALHDGKHPMTWTVRYDRDAFKELYLCFVNEHGRFPLYPGESAWIEYSYTVSDKKWGNWFQRAVRVPTRHLAVRLVFPSNLDTMVWGMETTMTAESLPLRTAIERRQDDGHDVFTWSTDDPPLHARYRLEWTFRQEPAAATGSASPSETMAALGIVQEGDPILREVARPFDLPAEAEDARRVIAELASAMERVEKVHTFGKGMGIAAPQLGIGRAVALVRTPDGETIALINPRVIETTPGDEQYEGCLSFFDVRGMVRRPLVLHVEHQDVDGERRITIFDHGTARLVAHEVDHLYGVLYTDRMQPSRSPIPVSEYRQGGQRWRY
jgi:peptide deformylase